MNNLVNKLKLIYKNKILLTIIILIIIGAGYFIIKSKNSSTEKVQYQTQTVEKGNIIVSISASGQVLESNSATVNTKASGVVSEVLVENGQKVQSGDVIAKIDLDLEGKQRADQAYSSYLSAKNSLENAKISYYSMQSDLLTNWKTYMDIAQNSTYQNSDGSPNNTNRQLPQYISTYDQWLSVEAKYKNQENVVAQSESSLGSSWLSYQQSSPIIYAPIGGTITGLSLQVGSVLTSQTNTSGTSTAQKIASVQTDAPPIIQVNLTQIDTPKVKIGNKATLTFDAFSGKTFTGKVISIDTIGEINSGVTTYPAMIKLDTLQPEIFSNMTATANIITQVKDNVLVVPVGAVQTQNESSFVRVLKNGKIQEVNVELGIASSTEEEITSGLSEGDNVITNYSNNTQKSNSQTTSPFSGMGGGGFRIAH